MRSAVGVACAALLLAGKGTAATPTPPAPPVTAPAVGRSDVDRMVDRIIEEGTARSRVMETLGTLTDVFGPRLTGSPVTKRAGEWARDQLAAWGLKDARLEAWGPFGRGWELRRFSMEVVSPQGIPLLACPLAWSPGWRGEKTGNVVSFDVREERDLDRYRGKLRGAFVLASPALPVAPYFEPFAVRNTDEHLKEMEAYEPPRGEPEAPPLDPQQTAARRARNDLEIAKARFLLREGAAAVLYPSFGGVGGVLHAEAAFVPQPLEGIGGRSVRPWDSDAPKILPQVVVNRDQYNRLVRLARRGTDLKMAARLAVRFSDGDRMAYNTLADLPGADRPDEVVMIGAHLDSWHAGTGATDDGAGVAACMEAMRILQALRVRPRRTIRIGLWTGEEQGTLGSSAYVSRHLAAVTPVTEPKTGERIGLKIGEKKPGYERFSGYFHMDDGGGKVRGLFLGGNGAVRHLFREWLAPLEKLGVTTLTLTPAIGSDHNSFGVAGLPGFMCIQDELDYWTQSHHMSGDQYERVQPEDLQQAAVTLAVLAYRAAMHPTLLPRKVANDSY